MVDVRGNVDTRIGFVAAGRLDAVVLAYAGLARLGRTADATEVLDYDVMLPAPGQGALAVECRAGDGPTAEALAGLDHAATRVRPSPPSEHCSPVSRPGAPRRSGRSPTAAGDGHELYLSAVVGDVNGGVRRVSTSGPVPAIPIGLGRRLAARVLAESCRRTVGSASPVTTRARKKPAVGSVSFVGAGPGDPGLLTMRATRAPRRGGRSSCTTPTCPCRVLELAGAPARSSSRSGPATTASRWRMRPGPSSRSTLRRTARPSCALLQGDPALFGGVGEEAAACSKAKVPFEIVPGVSSVTAVPAYAGLPLTTSKDREVHVIDADGAGRGLEPARRRRRDARAAARGGRARCGQRPPWSPRGRAPATTVAVTRAGTTTEQRTLVSTLEHVAADVKRAAVRRSGRRGRR